MIKLKLTLLIAAISLVVGCKSTSRFTHMEFCDSDARRVKTLNTNITIKIKDRKNVVSIEYDDIKIKRSYENLTYSYPHFTFRKKRSKREGLLIRVYNEGELSISYSGYGYLKLKDSTDQLGYGFILSDRN